MYNCTLAEVVMALAIGMTTAAAVTSSWINLYLCSTGPIEIHMPHDGNAHTQDESTRIVWVQPAQLICQSNTENNILCD